MKTFLYACNVCGSLRIQFEMWVIANTNVVQDSCSDTYWCPRCEDHYKYVLMLRAAGRDAAGVRVWVAEADKYAGRPRDTFGPLRTVLRLCCPDRPRHHRPPTIESPEQHDRA